MTKLQTRLGILHRGEELQLAIEGRFTNLRIWTGRNAPGTKHPFSEHDTIYMRLDKANAYSTPLDESSAKRLDAEHTAINHLLKFGFQSSISNLDEVLAITADMKERRCIDW